MSRLLAVTVVAALLAAASAPANACRPYRGDELPYVDPPAGLLHEGQTITLDSRWRARGLELALWAADERIPLTLVDSSGRLDEMQPAGPLTIGKRYHLVAQTEAHPGYSVPRDMPVVWWTAAVRDRQAELAGLLGKLALFGFLPFGVGYLATRRIIVIRRRRVLDSL